MSSKMVFKDEYSWKPGTQVPVSAAVAGQEINRIRTAHGGFFKPEDVVKESRSPDAPLHPAFEWDDTIAAEAYRVEQAGYIIRGLVVRPMNDPDAPPIRPIVSIVKEDDDGGKPTHYYTSTVFALSEPELRQQVLANALRDMQIFETKYSNLIEMSEVIKVMGRVRERMRDIPVGRKAKIKIRPMVKAEEKP